MILLPSFQSEITVVPNIYFFISSGSVKAFHTLSADALIVVSAFAILFAVIIILFFRN
jgi:hypothetical protein